MPTKPRRIDGVDLSHHNPVTEAALRAAKGAGVRFVYHKATEGAGYVDPTYATRRALAKLVGIPFGAYHFARPARGDAGQEANHFLKIAKPAKGDLAPCLDLETTEGLTMAELRAWAAEWVAIVRKATGVEPVVYTPFDLGTKGLRWRPRYNASNTPPVLPWDLWQFSNGTSGVPNNVAGLGRVDLNTWAEGKDLSAIPRVGAKPPKPAPTTVRVRVGHASMQFSDNDEQHAHDAEAAFAHAEARGYACLTGTEAGAGAGNLTRELTRAAKRHGYRFHRAHGDWVAVRKDLGPVVSKGYVPVHGSHNAIKDPNPGNYAPKGIPWVKVDASKHGIGVITFGAGHFLTKGAKPSQTLPGPANHHTLNEQHAKAVGVWARRHAKGNALVLWGADVNRNDRDLDVLSGAPLTTCWDELGKWPNTGHGPIDVIASYDGDGRVECRAARVWDDKALKLHTDHYLIEATYDVRVLPTSTSSAR